MAGLHRFQRYSGGENVVTNNTLYLLREISKESQTRFKRLISNIWDGAALPDFGLNFHQQVRSGNSVPDGLLFQERVCFVVETKLGSSFDPDQIRRHCDNRDLIDTPFHRYALLLFSGSDSEMAVQTKSLKAELHDRGIFFAAISFSALIKHVRDLYLDHHEEMLDLLEDFTNFCTSFELLPQDEWTVFVPACGGSYIENHSEKLYYCQSYRSSQPAKYLGIYYDKAVRAIGVIARIVVDPIVDMEAGTVDVNDGGAPLTDEQKARIVRACIAADGHGWPIDSGHKFYLCDDLPETEWRKVSAQGVRNRCYLNLKEILKGQVPTSIQELAAVLRSSTWT